MSEWMAGLQTKQFDTFDNRDDRREVVILFERLGEGLPEIMANAVRAEFLQSLIPECVGECAAQMGMNPPTVQVDDCPPWHAAHLFWQMCSALQIPMRRATAMLNAAVRKKAWLTRDWSQGISERHLMLSS